MTQVSKELKSGEIIDSRFQITGIIGEGGMGEVYSAFDMVLGRIVALKVMHDGLSANAMNRFRREVATLAKLDHVNLVKVYSTGLCDSLPYLSMEFVEGESLRAILDCAKGGRLPWQRVVELARQMCAGLARAHELGVVHRDILTIFLLLRGPPTS